MFIPILHHVANGEDVVVVFVDDARREFEGRFIATLEPLADTRVVRVDGAVVLAPECCVAILRSEQ